MSSMAFWHQLPLVILLLCLTMSDTAQVADHSEGGEGEAVDVKYPLYYGWFLDDPSSATIQSIGYVYYKMLLDDKDAFREIKKYFNLPQKSSKQDYLNYFTRDHVGPSSKILHCTAMYCGREGTKEVKDYMDIKQVQDALTREPVELNVIGIGITPRTLGARVMLSTKQRQLFRADQSSTNNITREQGFKVDLNEGHTGSTFQPPSFTPIKSTVAASRAHITLALAKEVEPVTTGIDLLDIVRQEDEYSKDDSYFFPGKTPVRYYGNGEFMIYFYRSIQITGKFKRHD